VLNKFMNFKEWLFNFEEGGFCKKGACAYGGSTPTPSNRPPKKPIISPRNFKSPKPHDIGSLFTLGGGPRSAAGGAGPVGGASMGGAPGGAAGPAGGAPPMGGKSAGGPPR
jgi:hypothetical protein